MVMEPQSFSSLSADRLREMVDELLRTAATKDEHSHPAKHRAAAQAGPHQQAHPRKCAAPVANVCCPVERYSAEQKNLLDETLDADLQAVSEEIGQLSSAHPPEAAPRQKQQPRRQPLPANLARREIRHEPKSTTCSCGCQLKRIGEDVAEKLDYQPCVFTVERHVRGKWACTQCQTLIQASVSAHVIDKGISTAGLLAHVLVAKYADHLLLYRQENIFAHAGLALPRSTLAQWVGQCSAQLQPLVDALRHELLRHSVLHPDETPVAMLKPGQRQDPSGLPVELPHHGIQQHQGRGVRLRRKPRRPACQGIPGSARQGRLARQPRVR